MIERGKDAQQKRLGSVTIVDYIAILKESRRLNCGRKNVERK
jgi:hypothetical protein